MFLFLHTDLMMMDPSNVAQNVMNKTTVTDSPAPTKTTPGDEEAVEAEALVVVTEEALEEAVATAMTTVEDTVAAVVDTVTETEEVMVVAVVTMIPFFSATDVRVLSHPKTKAMFVSTTFRLPATVQSDKQLAD